MDIKNSLKYIPLFKGLFDRQIEELSKIAMRYSFLKGKIIFSEGDEADGFYVLLSGRVKIFKVSRDGKEQILHIIEAQEPFGEVPAFAGKRFPANAEAIEDTIALFFPRESIIQLMKNDPSIALNMLALLSQRLRQFTDLVEGLSLKEVPQRLAAYMLLISDREKTDNIELNINKKQLASLLGTIPETISRILAKMVVKNLIDVNGKRIKLIDKRALEELAYGAKLDIQ
ncbi:MAG TPA: Crp/Fnr family transcriptional regulator [Syntrophorhabdaceae bacterium]|nr:Crp/Fnr family transcriptional regulator [Syntrophorhabdaceae bacterium]